MTKKKRGHGGIKGCVKAKRAPAIIVRGSSSSFRYSEREAVPVYGKRGKAERIERANERAIRRRAENAARVRRERKGSRRPDGEIRHVAAVPLREWVAMQKKTGDKCWYSRDDKKDKLEKMGRWFGG